MSDWYWQFLRRTAQRIDRNLASVGRNAKRQDRADWLGPKDEHAVTPKAADAQPLPAIPHKRGDYD